MSTMNNLFKRLAAVFVPAARPSIDPDALSLQQWADLPAHHPRRDRAA
ncbi:hypothetical protein [Devosia limi]|uniref:Uncharacterized protein n=1 Tax=Devosia limi DSM 17137 TaxID=1121477 RepID=A0A1M5FP55_9HYPH|nr:hypothetical protein [Devosia limi]SHF93285.1 hypothetical protein SAMN02745223_03914 [Devosia limi DSM 17137]